MTRAELWRRLIAFEAPHLHTIENERKKVWAKSNDEAGHGPMHIASDEVYFQTKGGSFTYAEVMDDVLGLLGVWWSYRTPVAVYATGHNMCLRSIYHYSATTSGKHMNAISTAGAETLRIDNHVADGGLTADTLYQQVYDAYVKAVQDIERRRKVRTWGLSVLKTGDALLDVRRCLGITEEVPAIYDMMETDKQKAKLTGWMLRDNGVTPLLAFTRKLND